VLSGFIIIIILGDFMNTYGCGEIREYIGYISKNPLVGDCSIDRFLVGLNTVAIEFGRTGDAVLLWLISSPDHSLSDEVMELRGHILVDGSSEDMAEIKVALEKKAPVVGYISGKVSVSVDKSGDSFESWFKEQRE